MAEEAFVERLKHAKKSNKNKMSRQKKRQMKKKENRIRTHAPYANQKECVITGLARLNGRIDDIDNIEENNDFLQMFDDFRDEDGNMCFTKDKDFLSNILVDEESDEDNEIERGINDFINEKGLLGDKLVSENMQHKKKTGYGGKALITPLTIRGKNSAFIERHNKQQMQSKLIEAQERKYSSRKVNRTNSDSNDLDSNNKSSAFNKDAVHDNVHEGCNTDSSENEDIGKEVYGNKKKGIEELTEDEEEEFEINSEEARREKVSKVSEDESRKNMVNEETKDNDDDKKNEDDDGKRRSRRLIAKRKCAEGAFASKKMRGSYENNNSKSSISSRSTTTRKGQPCRRIQNNVKENTVNGTCIVKKKRGYNIMQEIKQYQKSTEFLIHRLPFQRLVREITVFFLGRTDICFGYNAMLVLQEAAERHLVNILGNIQLLAIHGKRRTIMQKDFDMFHRLFDEVTPAILIDALEGDSKRNS